MLLAGITHKNRQMLLAQFMTSHFARTRLGKLLIDLLEDETWSRDFTVSASFSGALTWLKITHPSFPDGCAVMVGENDDLTVQGVQRAINAYMTLIQASLNANISSPTLTLEYFWSLATRAHTFAESQLGIPAGDMLVKEILTTGDSNNVEMILLAVGDDGDTAVIDFSNGIPTRATLVGPPDWKSVAA